MSSPIIPSREPNREPTDKMPIPTNSALDKQIGGTHYRQGKIQPIEYIVANGLGYIPGSVVKRVTRYNQETGKGRQDIEKAIHELQLLLELGGFKEV